MPLFEEAYVEDDYVEDDYVSGDIMAIDQLPSPPNRSDPPEIFIQKADAFLAALPSFATQADEVAIAMNNYSTNSVSLTSNTIGTGNKTFEAEEGKSYVVGQTVRAAVTDSPTVWMQGDLISYSSETGLLVVNINTVQGSGTYAEWTLSLSNATSGAGSLTQDFSVKSLRHAIAAPIASAATIDLSAVTGNLVHVTGNNTIGAVTMTSGKDVWVIFDGTPQLTYHATNLRLNSGGANITVAANGVALFTSDGTTVRAMYFRPDGKANVETAAPAGAAVGSGLIFFGSYAPANYLVCPTAATNISRTTYATLFAAIGTTWGVGDSATTFGMPWFPQDYSMIQANLGNPAAQVGTSSVGQVIAHTHNYSDVDNTGSVTAGGAFTNSVGNVTTKSTTSTGGVSNYAAGHRILICVKYQ